MTFGAETASCQNSQKSSDDKNDFQELFDDFYRLYSLGFPTGFEGGQVQAQAVLAYSSVDGKPKLEQKNFVAAVGMEAQKFLSKLDRRFKEKFSDVFKKQIREQKLFETTIFGQFVIIGVVPHPSGRNLFWGSSPMGTVKVLKLIRNEFIHTIGKSSAQLGNLLNFCFATLY